MKALPYHMGVLALLIPLAAFAEDRSAIDEITIFSAPLSQRPEEVIEPLLLLTGEQLERLRAGTIGDLLANQPGLANASFGSGAGRPVIRGRQGPRVQVLENGVRTMDISTIAADHAVAVEPLTARQVEVLKGPATLLYGSGAAGGVVNIINRRMRPDFAGGLTGDAGFSWSENGAERLGHLDLTWGWEDVALQFDVAGRRANDFDIPGFASIDGDGRRGVLENSSIDNFSGGVSGVWRHERGYVGLAISHLDQDYGLPEAIDPDDPEFERIELGQTRFDLRGELSDPLPGFSLARLAFGFNDYEQEEVEFEDGEREVEVAFENREFDLRMDLTHQPLAGWTGVLGLQLTGRDFRAVAEPGSTEPEDFFVPPTDTDTRAVFLIEERELSWGRLQLGTRLERVSVNPRAGERARFSPLSLSSGALIRLDEQHSMTLNLQRAQRAPAAEELFSNGRHAATRSFEIGEARLGLETATEFELGLQHSGNTWEWQLSGWHSRVDGFVFREFQLDGNGEIILVNDDGIAAGNQRNRLVNYRQRDAELYGVEAETTWQLMVTAEQAVALTVFGDLVRGRLRDASEDLPRITPARLGIRLDGRWQDWSASVDLVRAMNQANIGRGETATSGYSLLGLDLAWRTAVAGMATSVYLRGRNLLDEEVRLHTSFLKDDSPQPGRSVLGGVRLSF